MWTVASRSEVTRGGATDQLEHALEAHRRELTGYCYRMLGSGFDAEDAVQETMVRAWRNVDQLETQAALRAWLYRIATNVCLDMLQARQRRARPMDLQESQTADIANLDGGLPEHAWVQPAPDARMLPAEGDPAELAAARETVRLAFVAALQHLPPRQRAVLILREVLRWQASEVAELLDTTTVSVNSALQRARATMDAADLDAHTAQREAADEEQQALLARYCDAFERYDIGELVSLLRADAVFSMPPYKLWLRGPEEAGRWMLGPGIGCKDSRVFQTAANGGPAAATYKPADDGSGWTPWALIVLEMDGAQITGLHHFLYPELFPAFGLPERIERDDA